MKTFVTFEIYEEHKKKMEEIKNMPLNLVWGLYRIELKQGTIKYYKYQKDKIKTEEKYYVSSCIADISTYNRYYNTANQTWIYSGDNLFGVASPCYVPGSGGQGGSSAIYEPIKVGIETKRNLEELKSSGYKFEYCGYDIVIDENGYCYYMKEKETKQWVEHEISKEEWLNGD